MTITWERIPGIIKPSYLMEVNGVKNGIWIHSVQHPTAIRPYTVVVGCPEGESVTSPLSTLVAAKDAAIAYHLENGVENE